MVKIKGAKDKVRRKFVNSFARQYLFDHGVKMYSGNERILKPVGERLYKIKLPNTKYYIGEQFAEQGETRKITSYEEIKSIGFVIISLSIGQERRWETGQKVTYELRRIDETGEHLNKIPKDHYAEYDINNNAIRLMGPRAGRLSFGPWVPINKKREYHGGGEKRHIENYSKHADEMIEKRMNRWMNVEDEKKPVHIKEAAFMITNTNEIVCLPNVQDMPSIIVSGMKGCLIGTDLVLISDGTFKQIKEIKVGDEVLSPQEDGKVVPSKVLRTTSWLCQEMYEVRDENDNTLYTCSYNHLIPLKNKNKYSNIFASEAKEGYCKKFNEEDVKVYIKKIKGRKKVYGFTLDSPSQWYITNNFIITHNSGKCIIQDEDDDYVVDSNGAFVKMKDRPKKVICLDNNLKFKETKVKGCYNRMVEEILEIETKTGRTIKVTPEHPFFTALGWSKAEDLKVGNFVAVVGNLNLKNKNHLKEHEIRLITYALTRGRFKKGRTYLPYHRFNDINREIDEALKKLHPKLYRAKRGVVHSKGNYNKYHSFLKKYGLFGKNRQEMRIPNKIMASGDENIKSFISSFLTYGGELVGQFSKINKRRGFLLRCSNKTIMKQLKHLLARYEIVTYTEKKKTAVCPKTKKNIFNGLYNIFSYNKYNHGKFLELITPRLELHERRIEKDKIFLEEFKHKDHDLIIPKEVFKIAKPKDWKKASKELGWSVGDNFPFKFDHDVHIKSFEKIAKASENQTLKRYAESDVFWDKIVTIKKRKGRFKAWDLEVEEDTHNFIANDFVVHNSFALHSIVSRLFWKPAFNYKIAILNDSSRETGTWNLPNQDRNQINILKRLNERPLPLPCVYLHPLVREDYEKLFIGDVGFDVTIPFTKIVDNHKEYLNLKESGRYFTKIAKDLRDCKTQKDAEELFDDMILNYNVPSQTANKIRAEFDTLFDSKMTDISTRGQDPWSTSKREGKLFNPLTASLHAGILPVLETEFVSNYRQLLSIYFTYFVKDIFNRQKQDPDFLKEKSEVMLVIDECFEKNTMISTEDGPMRIKEIHDKFKKNIKVPKVMSYNTNSRTFELRPVINTLVKEQNCLLEINLGVSKIKCTPYHKIYTPKGMVQAKDLKEGDLLEAYYDKDTKNLSRKLNDDQMQIVLGSHLGGGRIGHIKSGSYRLDLTQGKAQEKYLLWKKSQLNIDNLRKIKSGYTGEYNILRSTSRNFELPFTVKKEEVNSWLLNNINEKGIAIWYMDDGSINVKNGKITGITIHSNSFDEKENIKLKKMFKQKFGIDCSVRKTKTDYYLGFNVNNSNKLLDLIGPYVHKSMSYKLGPKKYTPCKWDRKPTQEGFARIRRIIKINNPDPKNRVYDLTVDVNHNYIVCGKKSLNGVLVSNCHNISKKGVSTGADKLLRRCVREGRPRRLGTLLATQKFNELPDVIKDNTTYLICFKNVGEAAEIVNQYNMGKHMVNTIRDLDKHECIAYTTEHFIVYDTNGKKRKSKLNEVFRGKTLPPYSQHKKPNA